MPSIAKKTFERVIASGNHLLTQVKDNQPSLRHRLEMGAQGRKPIGCDSSQTKGRNRWETRELTVFPAKAWFEATPWQNPIKTVLRLERMVCKRDPKTGLCKTTSETAFYVSTADGTAPKTWNGWIRARWRIENGSHYVRDVTFQEDASRIRKNPDIMARLRSFAYNLLRKSEVENFKHARYRAALDINFLLEMPMIC
jgi:predicted transposase YbfD/YdcC